MRGSNGWKCFGTLVRRDVTISHRGQLEDGVQGTLQVGQVICEERKLQ